MYGSNEGFRCILTISSGNLGVYGNLSELAGVPETLKIIIEMMAMVMLMMVMVMVMMVMIVDLMLYPRIFWGTCYTTSFGPKSWFFFYNLEPPHYTNIV